MRLAFLGPSGTYAEQAARLLAQLEGLAEVKLVPQSGIRAVVQSLAKGDCDAAVEIGRASCRERVLPTV